MKYLFSISLLFLFFSCKENEKERQYLPEKNALSFEELIHAKINDYIYSSGCERKKVVEIRYQKYKNKEYVQISAQEVFINDSLYVLKDYKNYLIAFYNEEFFSGFIQKDIVKNDSLISQNSQWDFNKVGSTEIGYPCFDMYEKVGTTLIKVKPDTYEYNNLFADPPMFPAPEPPPLTE